MGKKQQHDDSLPPYLAFRPDPDTVETHGGLVQLLEELSRKVQTSNHLQAHHLAQEFMLPAFLLTIDWMSKAQRDLLRQLYDNTRWAAESHGVELGVPPELGDAVAEYITRVKETLSALRDAAELHAAVDEPMQKRINELLLDGEELSGAVAEAVVDEDEEEDPGDDEDDDDEDDDDDDEDDIVDTQADDEPLYEEAR